ncbi:MAG: 2,3-bisphosphoglycerate-independent phosphoglycerate mutase [Thermoleophilia bacterium]
MRDRVPLVALVILDGWGLAPPGPGNAVGLARTPVFDDLVARYPHTTLEASGVGGRGLPDGQMGNSEVGHLTIGAGRVVDQDLMRVNRAIRDGSFLANEALVGAARRARDRGGQLHLIGLVSHGGVHSHIDHVRALVELAAREGLAGRTTLHAFTDGRDVSPHAAAADVAELVDAGVRVGTVVGRYYAMDRDSRWERTDRALAALRRGEGERADDPVAAIRASYERGVTDEFVEPTVIGDPAANRIGPGDTVVFFNFRPDRGRQLSRRLLDEGVDLTTMTHYADDLDCPIAFPEKDVREVLAQAVAERGLAQLHVAETEKYAHVTYFLNGGKEAPWPGERRVLVQSPTDVATYDLKPEMSAVEVAARFAEEVSAGGLGLAVVNFANPDMVGHTGVIPAVVAAVEAVDACLGVVVQAVHAQGGVCIVFADHGNAEQMLEPDGASPHTAHTTNPVPCIVTAPGLALREGGGLADVAPTALELLGLAQPAEMAGRSLLRPS